ncbi:MAG: fibronectin type III domain-containing protein [Planctomycetota bacterium]
MNVSIGQMVVIMGLLAAATSGLAQLPSPRATNLQLWLKADAGVERDGHRITLWRDQSGNGNDARAEDNTAPLWIENGPNGQPAVRFDGAHSFFTVPHRDTLNAQGGFTAFCVFRYTDGFRLLQKKDRSGGGGPDGWFIAPQSGLGVAGHFVKRGRFARNLVHLQTCVFDPTAGVVRILTDGKPVETINDVAAPKPNTDPIHIGKRHNPGGTEGHLKGDVAEMLIYNTALADKEREQVEAYLRDKYGIVRADKATPPIVRVLPGNHQVTIEWTKPEKSDPTDLRYTVEAKLLTASWDDAIVAAVPGDQLSAAMTGLLNYADYSIRVRAERVSAGKQIGRSAERIVRPGPPPGVVIDYLHKDDPYYAERGQYIGSPSIARMPDGALVTSHDIFGPGTPDFSDDLSRVFRSEDRGETWRHVADVEPAFWGKVFVHKGELYLLACRKQYGDLLLHHSPDGGRTWEKPAVIAEGEYHKAPMPVIEHKGRLWTCVELKRGAWAAGFAAVAAPIPLDADLMNPKNWTVSEPLPYDPAWLPKDLKVKEGTDGLLEGNAVVDPDGNLLDILRYHIAPNFDKALVLNIAPDGKSLSFNRVINFYGGMTKFTIRRHPETGVYWSLVNRVTDPTKYAMRSVLTLVKSPDLNHWTLVRDVLRDDNETAPRYTAFQYVDWLFDGEDIIVASRTAFNGAHNFHDANYLTFHRVKDFAKGGMVGP